MSGRNVEYFSRLRGLRIDGSKVDAEAIPCIEQSDAERLCSHPVVSVAMITYNHEKYIRRAVESIMAQQANFDFELVIGEDCSQDATREICFEMQRKFPEKIRVLWWHENVNKLGGNGRRTYSHCRGEYIAFCEGDDYWVDPYKLQKQVDAMRAHPLAELCFCDSDVTIDGIRQRPANDIYNGLEGGLIDGRRFFNWLLSDAAVAAGGMSVNGNCIYTCTALLRMATYKKIREKYAIFSWRLKLGDITTWMAMALEGDAYYIKDVCGCYTINPKGACGSDIYGVVIDGWISRLYFAHVAGVDDQVRQVCENGLGLVRMHKLFASRGFVGAETRQLKTLPEFERVLRLPEYRCWVQVLSIGLVPLSLVRIVRRAQSSIRMRLARIWMKRKGR